MNILMLSSTFPFPPNRGGTEVRTFNLLRYLHQHHNITLVTQCDSNVSAEEIEELKKWVSELAIFPAQEEGNAKIGKYNTLDKASKLRIFIGVLIRSKPPSALHQYSLEMQTLIDKFNQSGKFDVVTCEHSINEIYIRPHLRNFVKVVINAHSSRYNQVYSLLRSGGSSNILQDVFYLLLVLKRYERSYIRKSSSIVVTTEEDRQQFLALQSNAEISVVPNGVDLDLFPFRTRDPGGHHLIFVGAMDASHNIDAARFFALSVFPKLRQCYPDATFNIVGARPIPAIFDLNKLPGVSVIGRVDSVAEHLHKSTVCVVPLRAGYGIKNKTLEAMATGIPIVGSDRALEGLSVDQPSDPLRALRANTTDEYLKSIQRLFEDSNLRQELSQNARSLIETNYTWEQVGRHYEQILIN